jgi:hypothetical protein
MTRALEIAGVIAYGAALVAAFVATLWLEGWI